MNLQESIMNDAATVNSPYPGLYAQGQRYQDIQNMMAPQYAQESPTALYKQARADLEDLAAPSVPASRGFGQPAGLLGASDVSQSPQVTGLLDQGGNDGMGGVAGDGSPMGFGGIAAASLGASVLGSMLGMPGLGTIATMGLLGQQGVESDVAFGFANPFGNITQMDVVMNALANTTHPANTSVQAGLGIGSGFADNEAMNGISSGMGFGGMDGVGGFGGADAVGGVDGMGMGGDSMGGGSSSDNDGVEGASGIGW